MKYAKVRSVHASLSEESPIDIEVDISQGLFSFIVVGLAGKAVEEARDRIYAAIRHSNYKSPKTANHKIVAFLGPANIRKSDTHFDLAIAIGYLAAIGEISAAASGFEDRDMQKTCIIGELTLDGSVRPSDKIIPLICAAERCGFARIILPKENSEQAAFALDKAQGIAVGSLAEAIEYFETGNGEGKIVRAAGLKNKEMKDSAPAFAGIYGQLLGKRAVEIALCGMRHLVLWGQPGTGKSLLCDAARALQPELDKATALALAHVRSFKKGSGPSRDSPMSFAAPIRSPHHAITRTALIGGGKAVAPGEISLAHGGILALNEFIEMKSEVLESLREPLEEGTVSIGASGNMQGIRIPARCMVIATCNPCPCGNYGSSSRCACPPGMIARYGRKVSGALWDRFDIFAHVTKEKATRPASGVDARNANGPSVAEMQEKIRRVREFSRTRNQAQFGISAPNAHIPHNALDEYAKKYYPHVHQLLSAFAERNGLSLRVLHKLMRISRTIADIDLQETMSNAHALEAIQFRSTLPH